jgi:hypothetical protein
MAECWAGCCVTRKDGKDAMFSCGEYVLDKAPSPEDDSWVADYELGPADGGNFFGMLSAHEHVIRCAKSGPASEAENPPQTLLGMFKSACDNAGDHVALAVERPPPPVDKEDREKKWAEALPW